MDVWGRCAFDSSEDLGQFRCLGVEIWKKPKKHEIWFDFRRFGFVSIGVPSVDVGGCSGGGKGVGLAALWRLVEKNAKYGENFAFWGVYGVSVAHKRS